jgi:hypothetical protein
MTIGFTFDAFQTEYKRKALTLFGLSSGAEAQAMSEM